MTTPRPTGTSASSALADSLCQGRHQAQLGLPDVRSEDSAFGDAIHKALLTGKGDGLDAGQLSIFESCQEIEKKLVEQVFGPLAPECKVFRETRRYCMVPSIGGARLEHSGQADVVYRHGPIGLVIDYKSLNGEQQDPSEHAQLRDLVVLNARTLLLGEVYAAIIQPLNTHSPSLVVYGPEQIAQAEQEMFARVAASFKMGAPRTPGEIQCKFCKAKKECKEYAAWASLQLPAPLMSFETPVAQWTPEECAIFCERLPIAVKWLDECKKAVKDRLKANPDAIPGWTIGEGQKRTEITNAATLHARFVENGGTTEQFMTCLKVKSKEFEGLLRKATELKGKALNKKMKELLEGITEETRNEGSLERKE